MAINITLISDWGNNNPYLSIFMGELLKNDILHNVIVISNDIAPNDFIDANYLFNATWHHFPNDTIHLITINSKFHLTYPLICQLKLQMALQLHRFEPRTRIVQST